MFHFTRLGSTVNYRCAVAATVAVMTVASNADTITQVRSQAMGEHWMLADVGGNEFWSNALAPTNIHDYVVPAGMALRTPEQAGEPAFAGRSLRIDPGGTLALKMAIDQDSLLLGNLILNGGALASWLGTTGNGRQIVDLNGNTLTVAVQSVVDLGGDNRRRVEILNGTLMGSGAIVVDGLDANDLLRVDTDLDCSVFDGDWIVNGGTLMVGTNAGAFGTANGVTRVNYNNAVAGLGSPTLELGGVVVTGETLIMSSEFNNHRTRLAASAGDNEWRGPIQLSGDGSVQFNANATDGRFILSGGITGNGPYTMMFRGGGQGEITAPVSTPEAVFFKTDASTWTIRTNGHRWASMGIAVGTLRLGMDNALPLGIPVAFGQAGGGGGTLDLAGHSQVLSQFYLAGGAPAGNQVIGNSSTNSDSVLTVRGATTTYGGRIVDAVAGGSRNVSVVVVDSALTLSGISTFTGPTMVSNASLLVSGRVASSVAVTDDSTYGGGGICGSNVTVGVGCTHAPGLNGTGVDVVYGNYSLEGTLEIELSGSAAGASDAVMVSNMCSLGAGTVLNVTELSPANDPVYVIGEYRTRVGTFGETNGLPIGYSLVYDFGPNSNQIVIARPMYVWDGGAVDDSWASGTNWAQDMAPPLVTEAAVIFQNAGTATTNTALTSLLDQDRRVAGLLLQNSADSFHRLDLNGSTLTVDGDLGVGGQGMSTYVTVTNSGVVGGFAVTNGGLGIGYNGGVSKLGVDAAFTLQTTNELIDIARRVGPVPSNTIATVDLSGAAAVNIQVAEIVMSSQTAENGGETRGVLSLSAAGRNEICATNVVVGDSPIQGNTGIGASEINFGGGENVVKIDRLTMPFRKSLVNAGVRAGGSLRLRGCTKDAMTLRLGYNDAGTGTAGVGNFDTRGATLDALFDTLFIGQHGTGTGSGRGTFFMDDGIAVAGNITFGVTRGSNPQNTIGEFRVDGGSLIVADSTTNGNGRGVLRIANGDATVTNTLNVNTVVVGGDGNVSGALSVLGNVVAGTGADTRSFYVARNLASANSTCHGYADLSACASVYMNVNNVGIGTGNRSSYGTLVLSETGTNAIIAADVTLGDINPQGNTAEWNTLVCGGTTHIDASTVYIGKRKSKGQVTFGPGGGMLTIGSTNKPVDYFRVAFNDVNTGAHGEGILNGSNGTLIVHADHALVGKHGGTTLAGSGTGRVILDSVEDFIRANTMVVGEGTSGARSKGLGYVSMTDGGMAIGDLVLGNANNNGTGVGTFTLHGGRLAAGTVRRGLAFGTSAFTFDWTGGELTVGTFDEDLVQRGGALVPGGTGSTAVTTVTGDYDVDGGWSIELDGSGSGTNDAVFVNGALTLGAGASLNLTSLSTADDEEYIIAEYGSLSGAFSTVTGTPRGYRLEYGYGDAANQVAVVHGLPGTVLIVR